jgi:hypothetical protein
MNPAPQDPCQQFDPPSWSEMPLQPWFREFSRSCLFQKDLATSNQLASSGAGRDPEKAWVHHPESQSSNLCLIDNLAKFRGINERGGVQIRRVVTSVARWRRLGDDHDSVVSPQARRVNHTGQPRLRFNSTRQPNNRRFRDFPATTRRTTGIPKMSRGFSNCSSAVRFIMTAVLLVAATLELSKQSASCCFSWKA